MKHRQIIRGFVRKPLNTSVIIISLAIGIAFTNLIILFITRELNTDSFQQNIDRIYLLKCDNPFEKGSLMSTCRKGGVEYIKENFSQVEDYCRIRFGRAQKVIIGNQIYNDKLVDICSGGNTYCFNHFTDCELAELANFNEESC